jgi:ribulose bisphosphate carboxylase small subunit
MEEKYPEEYKKDRVYYLYRGLERALLMTEQQIIQKIEKLRKTAPQSYIRILTSRITPVRKKGNCLYLKINSFAYVGEKVN